ncbi:uncharacterized protein BXZ73DRAFT_37303 [Epithele typhae]|uniref:uncharacterized protein n=1 Tax=Epithele typhae TaxID=378194 RepID=UPI002007EEB7|nr:uncharacterized protein BXZ73DRAFT_37303 [Epithele typhae]KAH9945878.1 hypothetical protein BXZ73DRAFT_37303 [Epithele typhae]
MTSYPDHWLEAPPPPSRFRRPWSPDPYDPLPHTSRQLPRDQDPYRSVGQWVSERRREPSDVSVEALDLADYSQTLHRNQHYLSQQPAFNAYDAYPPSPRGHRPLARVDSLSPPSLMSGSSEQSHSVGPHSPPARRPFSLPPPSSFPSTPRGGYSSSNGFHGRQDPRVASPDTEFDIAQFPSFAQGWYGRERGNPLAPPHSAHGHEGEGTPKRNPFDPALINEYDPFADPYNSYSSPPPSYPYGSSYGPHSGSSRDNHIVPWNADSEERPVDPGTKEERIRMLEREFGKDAGKTGEPETLVGSVDLRGRLITEGPRKRLATRWIQVLLSLATAVASLYTGFVIKPPTPAPPASKLPAYVLYGLSFISFFGCTFFYLIYPCCCGTRKPRSTPLTGPQGMMVLPVQGLPGGKPKKKGKKGKGQPDGGVQVNLIVDPSMFGNGLGREREEDDDDDDGTTVIPGSYSGPSSNGQRRRPKRRSVFEGLALEEQWKRARKLLKWVVTVDTLALLLWGTEFVLILLGKRCPVGGYLGWCDAYNIATAAACLLAFAFAFSIFLDVKDLSASRASPRTRT